MASSRSSSFLRLLWCHNESSADCRFLRPFTSLSSSSLSHLSPSLTQHSPPLAQSPPSVPFLCGRGDKKTKKGKRFRGKFGNPRPNREHRIRRIRERWEQPPGTPWPVPGFSVEDYIPFSEAQFQVVKRVKGCGTICTSRRHF